MSSPNRVGGYVFKSELTRGRRNSEVARESLRRIVDETPGPQTTAMLIAKIARSLAEIDAALRKIEEIASNKTG